MSDREILILTGMSGAGRSTVAHVLEDLGWYVVDNLPPAMILPLCDVTQEMGRSIAVVTDVRGAQFFDHLNESLASLQERNLRYRVLFVDASDDSLVRRFESTRRPHPLQGQGRILEGIQKERHELENVKAQADLLVDSSNFNIHQLERKILDLFSTGSGEKMKVNFLSFGYKYGLPADADLVIDCRFIPNPHWIPELRPFTGKDDKVREYVLKSEDVPQFLDICEKLFETITRGFLKEGRSFITIAVGCTGGKHRSVAIAEELANRLSLSIPEVSSSAMHRDLSKEM
jgi:RNase adapter protein RapZ